MVVKDPWWFWIRANQAAMKWQHRIVVQNFVDLIITARVN